MATAQTTIVAEPTKRVYVDDNDVRMTLNWIRRMPHDGYLGEVSYGSISRKPIQVFDAQTNQTDQSKTWQFQAQDGSFLLKMKVAGDQNTVTFLELKKGTFPLVTVYARFP
ncbi:MAG TPA: hypothetical protein VN643_20140 [Pyrinomonadaceae bacterium]|nr:hypothetical protein [Pyrinomonadaceae bacterium]